MENEVLKTETCLHGDTSPTCGDQTGIKSKVSGCRWAWCCELDFLQLAVGWCQHTAAPIGFHSDGFAASHKRCIRLGGGRNPMKM